MTTVARPRTTSRLVAEKPGCAPLKAAYEAAVASAPKSWPEVEGLFLRAMEQFDSNVSIGDTEQGERQNGKGDFLNDLLALLLENCSGVQLYSRGKVPGFVIPSHNLDVTFPRRGAIEFVLEAKALGTPKHPGSKKEKAIGRRGSADIDKRMKEVGFKTIDLKVEFSRKLAETGGDAPAISGDLVSWLRSVKPRSYVFLAARIVNASDLRAITTIASRAAQMNDGLGVFCFQPVSSAEPTKYEAVPVPTELQMSRVLFRACSDLKSISERRPEDV